MCKWVGCVVGKSDQMEIQCVYKDHLEIFCFVFQH
uniref:Uncharacterized protein n=1 Tax=Arundo donax TaxID=35708 RepID=A0A0A9FM46_ARUDO